jgi:hypothetical protein
VVQCLVPVVVVDMRLLLLPPLPLEGSLGRRLQHCQVEVEEQVLAFLGLWFRRLSRRDLWLEEVLWPLLRLFLRQLLVEVLPLWEASHLLPSSLLELEICEP